MLPLNAFAGRRLSLQITMDYIDLEIVGLKSATNGRSCSIHRCCGKAVAVGDVLRLVTTVVEVEGKQETAVKCVKVVNGIDGCTVAFVPWVEASLPKVKSHINRFVQVKELYDQSISNYKQRKSHMNLGMAAVVILHEDFGRDE